MVWEMDLASDEDSEFHRRADALLTRLAAAAEDRLSEQAETEFAAGILQVDIGKDTYIVNKHAPTRQVWLSSPVSGAWHFAWEAGRERWIDTRQGRDLLPLLSQEWASLTGVEISFDC